MHLLRFDFFDKLIIFAFLCQIKYKMKVQDALTPDFVLLQKLIRKSLTCRWVALERSVFCLVFFDFASLPDLLLAVVVNSATSHCHSHKNSLPSSAWISDVFFPCDDDEPSAFSSDLTFRQNRHSRWICPNRQFFGNQILSMS